MIVNRSFVLGAVLGVGIVATLGFVQQVPAAKLRKPIDVPELVSRLLGQQPMGFGDNVRGIRVCIWPRLAGSIVLAGPFRPKHDSASYYDPKRAFVPATVAVREGKQIDFFTPIRGLPGWHAHVSKRKLASGIDAQFAAWPGKPGKWDQAPFRKGLKIK